MKLIAGGLMIVGLVTSITYALAGAPSKAPAAGGKTPQAEGGRRKVVTTAYPQLEQYEDLRGLVAASDSVVVGVPVAHAGRLSASSSRFVWTHHQVKVLSVVKGAVAPGGLITVRTMGGAAAQADGTEVETRMPDFWKSPVAGEGYVFFLSKRGSAPGQYELTGGPQGLFLISPWKGEGAAVLSPDQLIVPQVRASDRLMKSYAGMTAADFVGRVSRVVATGAEGR